MMLPKDRGEDGLGVASGGIHPAAPISPRVVVEGVDVAENSHLYRASDNLHSVHHSRHPRVTPDDLADALEDVRTAGANLRLEMDVPLPTDTRHLATVLTRRAVAGADYVSQIRQAAFLADHLADRELED